MGNTLIEDKGKTNPMKAFEAYIDLNFEQVSRSGTFFDNKLFKTLSYKAESMNVVIKVYIHRKQLTNQEVIIHENNFLYVNKLVGSMKFSNLMPFQKLINFTDRQQYQPIPKQTPSPEEQIICNKEFLAVCRQQLHTTLYDKLHVTGTRINQSKLNYMTLQILLQIYTLHQLKLYHGHVRTSNILLTTNDHAVLSDFATYKPYYQREDQFGEFRNIYSTSIQNCTLAPEKFLSSTESSPSIMDLSQLPKDLLGELQQMDMFSVGVVIAELQLGDENLFTYEQLMMYRKGEFDPSIVIKKIGNAALEELVLNLIQKDASKRKKADEALQYFFDKIIPQDKKQVYVWFYYLDCAISQSYQFSQPDLRVQLIRKIFLQLLSEVCGDKNLPNIEQGLQFQFSQPTSIQKIPVTTFFSEILLDSQPKLYSIVQGLEKINLYEQRGNKFTTSFKPGTSNEQLLASEPYDNVGNLKIREYQECYEAFANQDVVRASNEMVKMTEVNKLRASIGLLQQRQSQHSQQSIDSAKESQLSQDSGQGKESDKMIFTKQIGFSYHLVQPSDQKMASGDIFKSLPSSNPSLLSKIQETHLFKKSEEAQFIVQLLCQQLQNLRFVQSKLSALEMIKFLSMYLNDLDNYYLTLPYVGAMFQDADNQVIQQAFQVFIFILSKLESPFETVKEIKLFGLYYWKQLLKILQNEDPLIQRFAFEKIGDLAQLVSKFEKLLQKFMDSNPEFQTPNLKSNWEQEFIETLDGRLQKTNQSQSTDNQDFLIWELIIQNLGVICHTFSTKNYFLSPDFKLMLISYLNRPMLRLCVIRNLPSFFEVISQGEQKHTDFFLMCIGDQCLYDQNELQVFYTVQFFRKITEASLLSESNEIEYLKKISPLILYPNLWIRTEAISYVASLVGRYTPMQVYLSVQPIIVKYLTEEVAYIDVNILRTMVGDMISRSNIDFKSHKIQEFGSSMTTRERILTNNFLENYLKKVKSPSHNQTEKDEKEEKAGYQRKLDVLGRIHDLEVALGRKMNDFIIASFKANLYFLGDPDDNRYEKLISQSRMSTSGKIPQSDESIMQECLLLEKIDIRQDTITSKKLKQLQALLTQFQSNLSYIIAKKSQSQINFRNIFNAIFIMHQIEFKARQIGVKEDLTILRVHSVYPPQRPFKPQQQLITTISEHKDIVSTVQNFRDQRYFISGSHDGTVRIFDMNLIDQDFTAGSVSIVKCVEGAEKINHKVVALKSLEFSDSFLVGTNTGFIELYKIDQQNQRLSQNVGVSQIRTFKKANSDIKKIETMNNEFSEAIFVYVTSMGEIVVEDIRSRSQAMTFSVGKERGLVTSMIQKGNCLSTCISTMNGYCLVYDLRCNLISNVFQLLSPDDYPLPIYTMANFKRASILDGVDQTDLVAIGFQSNYNEVGFWNLNDLNENLNPCIFLNCSDKRDIIIQNPRLKSFYKNEQFKNFSNTLEDKCFYNFVGSAHQMDLISHLKDPLTISQNSIKEKWLFQTKNCYQSMKTAFEAKSSVTSIISLPLSGSNGPALPGKFIENSIITASSDRCVQSWTLCSDGGKPGERPIDKELQGTIICQPSNYHEFQRKFTQAKSGDVYVIHDFELKNSSVQNVLNKDPQLQQNSSLRKEYRIDHKDCITDMTFLEREQGLLITSSRDKTIKIWK